MHSEVANIKKTAGFLRPLTIDYRPGQYVKELDGWRFIAVMAVIFMHYIQGYFLLDG